MPNPSLPPPARYFPIRNGRYEVTPGLSRLGTAFGNGTADACLFQFDDRFEAYRANKHTCRAERFGKYVCTDAFDAPVAEAVARLFAVRLATEHPALFTLETASGGAGTLHCRLTGDALSLDERMNLAGGASGDYRDAFDAICCQVQEDIAVVRRAPERGDWIAALHLCAPSMWAAEEKIGKGFVATHTPVPHIEKVSAASPRLIETAIAREPLVRFTWGISFDGRLNDHPEPPPANPRVPWCPETGPLYLRAERQVLWGLPEVDAFVFAIRVYLYPFAEIAEDPARWEALTSGLRSMSPESRAYKSLAGRFDAVLARLQT